MFAYFEAKVPRGQWKLGKTEAGKDMQVRGATVRVVTQTGKSLCINRPVNNDVLCKHLTDLINFTLLKQIKSQMLYKEKDVLCPSARFSSCSTFECSSRVDVLLLLMQIFSES